MKLKWYHAIVLLAVGAIALAACTGDAEPRSESTSTQQAAEEQSTPPEGDVFRRTFQDPPTLDPHHASDTLSSAIIVELFSGLVTINLDLQLAPDLAESWEVSSDGLTYTFRLRPNAVFHDGKPVTAHDVKYSFERALDPETGSATVDTYLDDIVGAEARLAGQAQEVEGVRVVDDRTITITIEEPRAYFLAKLTYPTAFVVDRENIEEHGDQWTQEPNGTGPFRLKEYRIGELMVLERNPDFYLEPAKVEQVELILSGGSSMAMYENDEIHITGVGLESLERVTNPSDPLNQDLVVAAPSFNITYIGFNVNEPPFDDLNVRQALSMVINKDLIAEEVLVGLVAPAEGILPPGFPGYTGRVQGLEFDPDRARQLLAESRYAGQLPRIVITIPGTGGSLGLDLEVIRGMWENELEVAVEIVQVEWATYLDDLHARKFQAFAGLGWQADYPDPQDFLDVLFHSQSQLNSTGYDNPEVDRWLEDARTAGWEERVELYRQVEQTILDDAPWVPLWFSGERLVLVKPYVKGYHLTPMILPKLRFVSIER